MSQAEQALLQAVLDLVQNNPSRIGDATVTSLAHAVIAEQVSEATLQKLLDIKRRAYALRKEFDAELAKLPPYAMKHVNKWLMEQLEKEGA